MLVLARRRDESIVIGDSIVVTIVDVRGDKCRLGIEAPIEIAVDRFEVRQWKLADVERRGKAAAIQANMTDDDRRLARQGRGGWKGGGNGA